ncbi:hypothetical protein [uncultured Aquimarina sp.]|uniref:hypothetical protein n=1 Tax=uncultured Aquimarina sp. TaxID=575652 RepID=UPI0026251547|nr:hypothetical protein [uncultured Aquimarina sp.]
MSKLILILIITLVTFFYGQDISESKPIKQEDSAAKNSSTTVLKEVKLASTSIVIIDRNNVLYNNVLEFSSSKNKTN